MMGAGIAHVAARAGIDVVLIDSTQEAADKGRAHSEALLDKGVQRRKVTAERRARCWGGSRPRPTRVALRAAT
jgi:3-hydroxyacyl-CoA dehydrogenase/enoyl-CoA hydratase/3-hydroxybutyryl-CoA epimerase